MDEGISNGALLRVMILKEVRTTFRERAQLRALIVSIVFLIAGLGFGMAQLFRHPRYHPAVPVLPGATTGTNPAGGSNGGESSADADAGFGHTPAQANMVRWGSIGGLTTVSFFFAMGYLLASCLATFVGEKEARTLEVLLASPLSDRKLFFLKVVSVLLPSAVIGYSIAGTVLVLVLVFVPSDVVELPLSLLFYALVLGLPIMLLQQIFFVGLGAAISAKAETFKGASQALSGVLMLLIFGGIYGTPLVLYIFPALRAPAWAFCVRLMGLSFPAQYAIALAVLGIPALGVMAMAKAFFRRDRMLT